MVKELTNLYQVGKSEGELVSKVEVAKKLLKKKINIEDIMEITELSKEEIKQIRKDF